MDFFNAHIHPKAIENVTKTLTSGWISEGKRVKEFEAALGSKLGLANPVTTNSGTAALVLALSVAGVGRGDEVILPAQTFVATGLAVLQVGATPVFADINPLTGNILLESIEDKLTQWIKAIIPVHWGGYPCDLWDINELARDEGLVVIEDACQALGADYRGAQIGNVSEFTCFSFQATKHLTTGDGGCLCCKYKLDAKQAKAARWFGIDRETSKESLLGERVFDVTDIGYKFHMNDIAASIGLGNLETLNYRLAWRQGTAWQYRQQLKNVPGLTLLEEDSHRTSAYWLFTVLVERREDFIRAMQDRNIPVSVVHQRIDKYSVFGGPYDLPGQKVFDEKHICLPIHDELSMEEAESVVAAIKTGW